MIPYHGDDATWIQTYTGKQFWPLDPRPEDVHIEDIAHALSMLCRFGGHCNDFYSVAQHSILVAKVIEDDPVDSSGRNYVLAGLLHDASEAYTNDITMPVKKHLQGFDEIEDRIERAIATRFDLPYPWPACIKKADNILLSTERRDVMSACVREWDLHGFAPLKEKIYPWRHWQDTQGSFLRTFKRLTGT